MLYLRVYSAMHHTLNDASHGLDDVEDERSVSCVVRVHVYMRDGQAVLTHTKASAGLCWIVARKDVLSAILDRQSSVYA